MGVVLWSILDLEGMRDGLEKKRTRKRKVRRSKQGKRRRGFKPDAAAGPMKKPERDHIRLRGVGFANIENRSVLRKEARGGRL